MCYAFVVYITAVFDRVCAKKPGATPASRDTCTGYPRIRGSRDTDVSYAFYSFVVYLIGCVKNPGNRIPGTMQYPNIYVCMYVCTPGTMSYRVPRIRGYV